ncbi:MAG: sporulation protein YqfD [Firmicutes bacterium]|nr:sporulation protein YqfD [Bacillota bacterium]
MLFKILLNYILGYVNIRVESVFAERFVNVCISKKIFLWNIKREKMEALCANIGIGEYKKLKSIAKKTNSKITIKSKKGLPFILHKYRKRKIFLALLFLIIVGLVVSSNFIWNIEITGEESISKEDIMQTLNKEGLKIGILKSKLDSNKIVNDVRLERDDISWIGISIKGTNAIVKIKEWSPAPEVINENDYCNIVSDKSGIITEINVQNGTANVKTGDIVQPGTVLISGVIEGQYSSPRYVHSLGVIKAKVWYTKKERVYLNQKMPAETGNIENKYSIKLGNFKINFYKTLSKFQNYDTISSDNKLRLFSNFYLPIDLIKTTNKEYIYKDVTYTEEQAADITANELEKDIQNEVKDPKTIINTQVNTYVGQGYIDVEVIVEALENIGIEQKI